MAATRRLMAVRLPEHIESRPLFDPIRLGFEDTITGKYDESAEIPYEDEQLWIKAYRRGRGWAEEWLASRMGKSDA